MLGKIHLHDLKVPCLIGVYPDEKEKERILHIDLSIEVDLKASTQSDSVADTIDYAALADLCRQVASMRSYHLLEKVAHEIMEALFTSFPVKWAKVKVKKERAIPEVEYVTVEFEKKK